MRLKEITKRMRIKSRDTARTVNIKEWSDKKEPTKETGRSQGGEGNQQSVVSQKAEHKASEGRRASTAPSAANRSSRIKRGGFD